MNVTIQVNNQRIQSGVRVLYGYDAHGLGHLRLIASDKADNAVLDAIRNHMAKAMPERIGGSALNIGPVTFRSQTADEEQALDAMVVRGDGQVYNVREGIEDGQPYIEIALVMGTQPKAVPGDAEDDGPQDLEDATDIEGLTLAELKTLAAERQVQVTGTRKADYVAALSAAADAEV